MSTTATVILAGGAAFLVFAAILYLVFHLRFERWKRDHTRALRRDAVQRSQAVTLGKVCEHLIPYLPDFRWNPKDARFVGSPFDFLVFDGLSDGALRRIVFVEVKTGSATMSTRERQVRDAVLARKVEWQQLSLPDLRILPEQAV
jgi:predicted Holliday junction resolvase-like endonuclease